MGGNPRVQKVEQNDPNGAVLKSVKPGLSCGTTHRISIWQPTVIVDCHMHIQSGRCAPLQYVQSLSMLTSVASRRWIEGSGSVLGHVLEVLFEPFVAAPRALLRVLSDGPKNPEDGFLKSYPVRKLSEEAEKTTGQIGIDFLKERKNLFENYFAASEFYKDASHLVFSSAVMTMDMEYAHIDGYYGIKVYNPLYKSEEDMLNNQPVAYWTPQHGKWLYKGPNDKYPEELWSKPRGKDIYVKLNEGDELPGPKKTEAAKRQKKEAKGYQITGTCYNASTKNTEYIGIDAVPVLLPDSETTLYENWKRQLDYTEMAVISNPLNLLPMFHYDPRRWQTAGTGNDEPMSKVSTKGIYLGFKMYTAQGYRPWDVNRLPIMEDFYYKCCKSYIPIMNHCTPGGAATFEKEQYIEFKHQNDSHEDDNLKIGKSAGEYFNEQFVSPYAWKRVLDAEVNGRPLFDLRICLAHFGGPTETGMKWNKQIIEMIASGKYPNLYTDISSSFADSGFRKSFKDIMQSSDGKFIKQRTLFGTDWFMTLFYGTTVGKNLWDYCTETKEFLDSFDTSLWPTFSQYNPYNFYRLDLQIQRIANNIIAKRKTEEIEEILKPIKDATVEEILREAAWIKVANESHVIYYETP